MFRRMIFAAALLCGAIGLPAFAQEDSTWAVVRGWTIGVSAAMGNGCYITAPFEGGMVFRLGLDPSQGDAYVVFGDRDWESIETDKSYPVTMQMGHKSKWNGNATGGHIEGIPALILSSDNEDFVIEMASQSHVRLWTGGKEIANMSLNGTMAAIQEMLNCQDAMNKVPGTGGDPFADKGSNDPFAN